MAALGKFIANPLVHRSAIILYVLLLLGLAAFSFSINTRDVRSAVYIQGHADLHPGASFSARGLFHYAPTGEILQPSAMTWSLLDAQDREFELPFASGNFRTNWPDLTLSVPEQIPPGEYELRLIAEHERLPPLVATETVTVHPPTTPPETLSESPWPTLSPRDDNAHRRRTPISANHPEPEALLAIAPADGEILRGLPQEIHLRVFDAQSGSPLRAALKLRLEEGLLESTLPERISTNSLGIAKFTLTAATDLLFHVEVELPSRSQGRVEEDSSEPLSFRLQIYTVAAQFSLSPHRDHLLAGDEIIAQTSSLLRDYTYMVDLYDGDRLLDTLSLSEAGSQGHLRFPIPDPKESSPLLRLQVYQSIYGTQHGWDSIHLLRLPDDERDTLRQAALELYTWIAENTESPHHRAILEEEHLQTDLSAAALRFLLNAGLAEIPRTFHQPPVLMNTRQTDREALDAWRAEVKTQLNRIMALLLLGGIAVFLYFVLLGVRRNQREALLLAEVDLETDLETPEDQLRAIRLEALTVVAQGAIVVFTLLAFALGILLVVSYL